MGLIVLLLYWYSYFSRTFSGQSHRDYEGLNGSLGASMPALAVIDGWIFAAFALLSVMLIISSFSPRGGFRPADVDVLFPTPVSPRLVLVFRIVRDTLLTLIVPLLLAILARPAAAPFQIFLHRYPGHGQLLGKTASVSWLLMAMAWTSLSYALSLFINRSDERSDRNKAIIERSVFVLIFSTAAFIGLSLRTDLSWETAFTLSHHPWLRVVFFSATMATASTMAPLTGDWQAGAFGVLGLLAVILGSVVLALTQVDYLYDQAAAKGFGSIEIKKLHRRGDIYGVVAEQARQGRHRGGRLARRMSHLRMRGGAALLWKDLVLQTRGALWQYLAMFPITASMVLVPLWGSAQARAIGAERTLLLIMLAVSVLIVTLQTATSGFIELLRRVDFQKPLPFSPAVTVFWEVVAKTLPTALMTTIIAVGAMLIEPRLWDYALGSMVMAPSLGLILAAVVMLVTVLFPDVEDATQRSFRGLIMMLGCVVAAAPMIGVAGVLIFWNLNGLIVAVVTSAIALAIAVGLCVISGILYAGFNPSE